MAVVNITAAQTSKNPHYHAFTEVYPFLWALHDCLVQSEHIPRVSNTVTDAISRNNLQVLFREVPGVSKVLNPIHPALRQLLVGENC